MSWLMKQSLYNWVGTIHYNPIYKLNMDVSKNRGTQNGWFIMENPIKMDDLGGTRIFGNTHI